MFDRDLSIDTVDALLDEHGPRLRELVGHTLETTWVAWDLARNEWFADEAVILAANGSYLEIVCWKLTDIVVSWGAIDRRQPPSWVAEWGPEFSLEWRRDATDGLRAINGKRIVSIDVVEYLQRTTVVADPGKPSNVGTQNEAWLLHGLEFGLGDKTLQVFNALDRNGLAFGRVSGKEVRRTRV